ncbi:MAG: ATP-binding protein [Bryobacterales bacterium]|nr:ATP-binding protein [Bryobacterales bacterium]
MEPSELTELLSNFEPHRVDYVESPKDKDKTQQAICAFANDLSNSRQPGVLFVGVDDNGAPTGLPITDGLLLDLSQIRDSGNILPIPSMSVEKVQLKGADIAVVIVERRLAEKRRYHDPSFDLWPVPEARLTDLDLRFINDDYLPAAIDAETLESQ